MTNPLDEIKLPTIPTEQLQLWGLSGKQTARKLTNDVGDASDALEIMRAYAGRESALDNFLSDEANAEDQAVADFRQAIEEIDDDAADLDKAREKALEAFNAEWDAKAKEIEDRRESAEVTVLDAHPEVLADIPSADDNQDAVLAYDLARASVAANIKKAIDGMKSRNVKIKSEDGTETELTIAEVLESFAIPNAARPGRRGGSKGSGDLWKPRWSEAILDGKRLDNPRVPAVAKSLGISRDNLLNSLLKVTTRTDFDDADTGAVFNFIVSLSKDGGEMVDHSIKVTKGTPINPDAKKTESTDTTVAEADTTVTVTESDTAE